MQIIAIPSGVLRANSYLVTENGTDAVLIDCGGSEPLTAARKRGLQITHVLLTHGHFDHCMGCAALQDAGAKIGCAKKEKQFLFSEANLATEMGLCMPPFSIDFFYEEGDLLELSGVRLRVLETPGHTPGGVCFQTEDALFTGDTLFCESVGRTDFPGGNTSQLIASVRRLLALPGDCTVYPGHDCQTTLQHERKWNPYA